MKLEESIRNIVGILSEKSHPQDESNLSYWFYKFAEAVREGTPRKALPYECCQHAKPCNCAWHCGHCPEPFVACCQEHTPEPNRKCGVCGAPNCQKDGHWFECPNLTLQCSCGKKVPHGDSPTIESYYPENEVELPAEVKEKITTIMATQVYGKTLESIDQALRWGGGFKEELESLARLCLNRRGA